MTNFTPSEEYQRIFKERYKVMRSKNKQPGELPVYDKVEVYPEHVRNGHKDDRVEIEVIGGVEMVVIKSRIL